MAQIAAEGAQQHVGQPVERQAAEGGLDAVIREGAELEGRIKELQPTIDRLNQALINGEHPEGRGVTEQRLAELRAELAAREAALQALRERLDTDGTGPVFPARSA